MIRFQYFVLLMGVILAPASVQSLDEESAKEQVCFPITKTVPVDMQWMMSMKTSYYPLMSRLDLYRVANDISRKDFKDISESELYYESCMYFTMDSDTITGRGFNGKTSQAVFKLHDDALEKFEFTSADGFSATCYTTMTDNKSFTVSACCMSDNQMTWGVASNVKKLPKETVSEIYDHAESLGFKREYFTALRYDACPGIRDESEGFCTKDNGDTC